MKLINLTNDPSINVYLSDGSVITYPQSGCLRVNSESKIVDFVDGVAIRRTQWIREDLPPVKDGVMYIVSSLTAMAIRDLYPERRDFICPNTHPDQVIRKGKKVVGVMSFQCFW